MTFTRTKMNQDDLEEEILLQSVWGHVQVVAGMLQSQNMVSLNIGTLVVTSIVIALSFLWFLKYKNVNIWLSQLFSLDGSRNHAEEKEWSESNSHSSIFSMQGKRDNNEDRAIMRTVKMPDGANDDGKVHIWAVMDGHGGQFCADFSVKHFIPSLVTSVEKLKLLTSCSLDNKDKLELWEKHYKTAPDNVRKYLQISEPTSASDKQAKRDSSKDDSDANNEKIDEKKSDEVLKGGASSIMSRCQLVLSTRTKSLEELPAISKNSDKNESDEGSKTPRPKPRSKNKLFDKNKSNKAKSKDKKTDEQDITEFIKDGQIQYPKLLKYEISQFDCKLLEAAKKSNNIGGTTLVLAIHDNGTVWVANVGDSRAVFANDAGMAIPMSYDHKPCQLKEKKRIQEAGGFVAMNGVWRVMGVLATSRALGDYPLKEKKVVVCDPDILSFNISDHKMQFAILASDGLWDTHTNEDAVTVIGSRHKSDSLQGTEVLAREAFTRGSLDNITVLVIDFIKLRHLVKE